MERGFGGEGVRDRAGADAGGYIFRCFLVCCSGRFLGVVFRVSRDVFFGFQVPLGSPGGLRERPFQMIFDNL